MSFKAFVDDPKTHGHTMIAIAPLITIAYHEPMVKIKALGHVVSDKKNCGFRLEIL